ncbi:MAG: glycoside hydrolase family 3 C-terminal domain-containing protein [Myxococcales bacterium]|nr:glycoside hydrolase family 3 C-terminal domain-containing protein [Myxococcales bacterium]
MRSSTLGLVPFFALFGCASPTPAPAPNDAQEINTDSGALSDAQEINTDAPSPADVPSDTGRRYEPEPFVPTDATRAYCAGRDAAAIEARITGLLQTLTPTQKRSLMAGAALGRTEDVWLVRGVPALGIPGFRMIDGPRGVAVLPPLRATAFPTAMLRGASWDPSLEERVGAAMANEALSAGATVLLAPTINILRHPRWGRAQETYSEDTTHMGSMAVGFVRGVQSRGVLATLKHFAANSIENTRHRVDVRMDPRTLREVYLPHFRRAIHEANASSVMSAYNKLDGLYCDNNRQLLTEILRDEWGFQGFVVSDWVLGTHGATPALTAGLDLEMPSPLEFAMIPTEIANGALSERDLDRAVRRLLRAQFCFGLDARTVTRMPELRETMAHLALAREAAQRSIVLLKNATIDTAPVLPLDASRLRTVVVLGRSAAVANIGDYGSSAVPPSSVVTTLDGLRARAAGAFDVVHIASSTLDAASLAAVRAASAVVIVTGSLHSDEGEATLGAGDRASLALAAEEVALVRAAVAENPRTIVVLESGAALETASWDAGVAALLWAGYPGSQGGHAIADVLFGAVEPSGRLPFSMPVREADLPPFDNTSERVTYEFLQGYRHLQQQRTAPRFAFGFGLSYSSVRYESITLATPDAASSAPETSIEATVTVRNTGARRARETVQLYVSATASTTVRAPRDLRAFSQVEIAPGATVTVPVRFALRDLAVYDTTARRMVIEPTTYELQAGPDSERATLRATLTVR